MHACLLTRDGCRLLLYACDAGAPQLITLLLDLSEAAGTVVHPGTAVAAGLPNGQPGTLTPLHRAVRCGSLAAVQALLDWSHLHDLPMQVR